MNEPGNDDEVLQDYLAECREHLATIETDLLAIEQGGAEIDEQLVNRVFRAAHSIKGGAGFFDLTKIRELAHKTENALDLVRCRQMVPTPEVVSILLLAFDKLRVLIGNHQDSNYADISEFVLALTSLAAGSLPASEKSSLSEQVDGAVARRKQTYPGVGVRFKPGPQGRQVRVPDRIRSDSRYRAAQSDALGGVQVPDQVRHDSGDGIRSGLGGDTGG